MPTNFLPIDWLNQPTQYAFAFNTQFKRSLISAPSGIRELLSSGCAVAVGVSGGKDSQACALAVSRYLEIIGHKGPRVLVHADLGPGGRDG